MQSDCALQNSGDTVSTENVATNKNRLASRVILLAKSARKSRKDLEHVLSIDAHKVKSLFHGNLKSISANEMQSWVDILASMRPND